MVPSVERPPANDRRRAGAVQVLFEPELHLETKEPLIPDLAGWRLERMPKLPDTAHFAIVPDWVCEIVWRSTERIDREEKLPYYARHGVRHVWLVDPIEKRLEVYTLGDSGDRWLEVRIHAHESSVRARPFDAIEVDLEALWSPPRGA